MVLFVTAGFALSLQIWVLPSAKGEKAVGVGLAYWLQSYLLSWGKAHFASVGEVVLVIVLGEEGSCQVYLVVTSIIASTHDGEVLLLLFQDFEGLLLPHYWLARLCPTHIVESHLCSTLLLFVAHIVETHLANQVLWGFLRHDFVTQLVDASFRMLLVHCDVFEGNEVVKKLIVFVLAFVLQLKHILRIWIDFYRIPALVAKEILLHLLEVHSNLLEAFIGHLIAQLNLIDQIEFFEVLEVNVKLQFAGPVLVVMLLWCLLVLAEIRVYPIKSLSELLHGNLWIVPLDVVHVGTLSLL